MPSLANKRQELFAQALAEGLTQASAALKAGYAESTGHALAHQNHIVARVEEIKGITYVAGTDQWTSDEVTKQALIEKALKAYRYADATERATDMLKVLNFIANLQGYLKPVPVPVEPPEKVDKKEQMERSRRVDEALKALAPAPPPATNDDNDDDNKGD